MANLLKRIKDKTLKLPIFAFNRHRGNHPAYFFKYENNKVNSLLVTHAKNVKKGKRIKLQKNPDPNDFSEDDVFVLKRIFINDKKVLKNTTLLEDWGFSEEDLKNIEDIIKSKNK